MNSTKNVSYESVLNIISQWPVSRQRALVEEVLKTISPRVEPPKQRRRTIDEALGILATDRAAPTDEEVKQWLDEHRMEKYG